MSTQLSSGWHLMPITLGPQASCSTRFPRYGASIDPVISANSTNTFATARSQGTAEASKAVTAASNLGIVPGSTIFYDLEAFDITNSLCRQSALWFMHAWTDRLHALGYVSGYYSSAASGIKMLDDARVYRPGTYKLPDRIWIADWNGRRDTSSSYVREWKGSPSGVFSSAESCDSPAAIFFGGGGHLARMSAYGFVERMNG